MSTTAVNAAEPAQEAQSSRAQELDQELRSCVRTQIALDARIAVLLAEMQQGKLWRQLGCTSLSDYGRKFLGYSSSKTSDLLQIGRRDDLPELIEALEEGAFGYKAAVEIARVATPETIDDWIRKGKELRLSDLKADARGEEPKQRVVLDLTQDQFRSYDSGIEFVRRSGGPWDKAEIVAMIFADFMERHANSKGKAEPDGEDSRAPRNDQFRVHLDVCPECKAASQETSVGAVPLQQAEVERICCDVEVIDLREGSQGRVTRTIPTRVRNVVWGRDRGRCQAPGCRLRGGIQIHHLDHWWNGHDPERMLVLCTEHHEQVHEELLQIWSGEDGTLRFATSDGVELGAAGDPERIPLGGITGEIPLGGNSEIVELAVATLSKTAPSALEARRWVERALAREPGREWDVEDLVREALGLEPGQAA